jgi:hypothetical protein
MLMIAIVTLTRIEVGTRLVEHYCNRPNRVWGKIVEGLWNFLLEDPLSVKRRVGYYVGYEKILKS